MKLLLPILSLFICSVSFSQEDPFDFDNMFSMNSTEHINMLTELGFSLEKVDSANQTCDFINVNKESSVLIFFENNWSTTTMVCFYFTDPDVYFNFLFKTDKCKRMKDITSEGQNTKYSFDGKKHDGLIEFNSEKLDNGKLFFMIRLMKTDFSKKQ